MAKYSDKKPLAAATLNEFGFATRAIWEAEFSSAKSRDRFIGSCGRSFDGLQSDNRDFSEIRNLEVKLAKLEGAEAGLVLSSSVAAFSTMVRSLVAAGERMLVQRSACTATTALIDRISNQLGVEVFSVDLSDPENICRAANGRTRLLYLQAPSNPLNDVVDILTVTDAARSSGLRVAVDSTFASPALLRPIEHGADIVLHSLTKYINGHGDTVGGVALSDDETIERMRVTHEFDREETELSPDAAGLVLRGLKTLSLRMDRHSSTAHAVALALEAHPAVAWVRYPFLESHPDHAIARKQMSAGSGLLAFGMRGPDPMSASVVDRLRLVKTSRSFGEIGSLVCRSADISNAQHLYLHGSDLCDELGRDVIRCSIGLEDAEDLIEDFWQAIPYP